MPTLFHRVRALFARDRLDRELDEEMRQHLERLVAQFRREGLDQTEARRRARIEFGAVHTLREEARDARGLRFLEELSRDLRYGVRTLCKAPGFSAAAILTLALGIGATTAIFAVVNGVILKPLPFEDQDELVGVRLTSSSGTVAVGGITAGQYFTYRDESRLFEDIGSYTPARVSVTGLAEPAELSAARVTAGILPLLRIQPTIGRRFTEEDDSPGAPQTIMLSDAYWHRQFGADPGIVGRTLRVNGTPRVIIGVLPPRFVLPPVWGPMRDAAIYMPFQWDRVVNPLIGYNSVALARLIPGTTIAQANRDMERMLPMWLAEYSDGTATQASTDPNFGPALRPLKEDYIGDLGSLLWVLLGSVGIVLLIACANVANLFLVRAEGRQQEVAIRTALGAARGQIACQFLLESVALGLMGGLAGLGLALGGVRLLTWMGPDTLPRLHEISLEPTVLAFTLGISVLSGLSFGLYPVVRVGGWDLVSSLKAGGRGGRARSGTARDTHWSSRKWRWHSSYSSDRGS